MWGSWDIMHELYLIDLTIYIRCQPVILFTAKGEKKIKDAFGVHFLSSCMPSFGRIKLLLKCLFLSTDDKVSQG